MLQDLVLNIISRESEGNNGISIKSTNQNVTIVKMSSKNAYKTGQKQILLNPKYEQLTLRNRSPSP